MVMAKTTMFHILPETLRVAREDRSLREDLMARSQAKDRQNRAKGHQNRVKDPRRCTLVGRVAPPIMVGHEYDHGYKQ
jgi:hypothetical protein